MGYWNKETKEIMKITMMNSQIIQMIHIQEKHLWKVKQGIIIIWLMEVLGIRKLKRIVLGLEFKWIINNWNHRNQLSNSSRLILRTFSLRKKESMCLQDLRFIITMKKMKAKKMKTALLMGNIILQIIRKLREKQLKKKNRLKQMGRLIYKLVLMDIKRFNYVKHLLKWIKLIVKSQRSQGSCKSS